MRHAYAGSGVPSFVFIMKCSKKLSGLSMVSRKGVVHLVGSPGGEFPFWSYVLSISVVPMRWVIAGCAQYR